MLQVTKPLSRGPSRRKVLDCTIKSGILTQKKPHSYYYYICSLYMRCEATHLVAAHASDIIILSIYNTKVVSLRLKSKQGWKYLSFLSFYAFTIAFSGDMRR